MSSLDWGPQPVASFIPVDLGSSAGSSGRSRAGATGVGSADRGPDADLTEDGQDIPTSHSFGILLVN